MPLAARTAPRCDSRTRPGGSAVAKRDLLVGVRLRTGVTVCLHGPTRASTRRRECLMLSPEAIERGSSANEQNASAQNETTNRTQESWFKPIYIHISPQNLVNSIKSPPKTNKVTYSYPDSNGDPREDTLSPEESSVEYDLLREHGVVAAGQNQRYPRYQ